jgi:predicted nucleotidyltransferase
MSRLTTLCFLRRPRRVSPGQPLTPYIKSYARGTSLCQTIDSEWITEIWRRSSGRSERPLLRTARPESRPRRRRSVTGATIRYMSTLDDQVVRLAESVPGISALMIFGSRVSGSPRSDSDLDVGVLPDSKNPQARRRLQSQLAVALADLAPDGRVDVVLMDEVSDLVRQRILETGKVLICRDPAAFQDLRVQTMREYGDREWVRRLMRTAQRRRLERGGPSGRSGRALESLGRIGKLPL